MLISAPRGTKDILPETIYQWQYVEHLFFELCQRFNYQEIRTPTFESTDLFQRGVGETTDIVQKEMYTFLDKSDRSITLKPEGTAGVIRSFIQQGMQSKPFPVKLCYNINAFRYERVAKGRYREFSQLGAEAIGAHGPSIDAEIISLIYLLLKNLQLNQINLHISSVGTAEDRIAYNVLLKSYIEPHLDQLCGDCKVRFDKNPLRIIDCKIDASSSIIADAPRLLHHLGPESKKHFEELCSLLDAMDIGYTINPNIVRGLDYYALTVFEFVSENVGTQGTICGGGRYDYLVENLGGQPTPAIGFAIGTERLLMEIEAQNIHIPKPKPLDLFIACLGDDAILCAQKLSFQLKQESFIVEADLCSRSLKAQLKYADKMNAKYILILGENEMETKVVQLKNYRSNTSKTLSLDSIDQLVLDIKKELTYENN